MDGLTIVDVLSRWAHVGAAVVLLGGSVFARFVLMPAAAELVDAEHAGLRQRVMGRWRKIVMVGILLLLVSGFYNYLKVAAPAHRGDGLYHGLMGVKILLAFGAFFLASVLTGRSPKFEPFRSNARKWLAVLILLSTMVVAIGGLLKVVSKPRLPSESAPVLQEPNSSLE